MNRLLATGLLFTTVIILSCKNDDEKAVSTGSSEVDPESIFFDYQVTGEEGNDLVTLLLQYRHGGEFGPTLILDGSSRVQVDGELLKMDSAKVTGAYYEIQKPVDSFSGSHTIIFTNNDNRQYKEKFSFQPLILLTEIPETVPRGDLELELAGLETGDLVRVLLTDTLFGSEGIDRLDTVAGNRIFISREEMEELTDGPIQLQLVKESETPAAHATRKGGRVYMSYKLKREFILVNEQE